MIFLCRKFSGTYHSCISWEDIIRKLQHVSTYCWLPFRIRLELVAETNIFSGKFLSRMKEMHDFRLIEAKNSNFLFLPIIYQFFFFKKMFVEEKRMNPRNKRMSMLFKIFISYATLFFQKTAMKIILETVQMKI